MNTYRNAFRLIQNAVRTTLRAAPTRAAFEPMEDRRLMSATSVRAVDSGGPDYEYVESNGHVIALTSSASGAGSDEIWRTDGSVKSSKKLLDDNGAIGSFDDLVVASDGSVYFTATGADVGGRQVFKLNVDKGGYSQVTAVKGAFYSDLTTVGTKLYMFEGNADKVATIKKDGSVGTIGSGAVTALFAAKDSIFWVNASDGGLWTTSDDGNGRKLTGDLTFGASKVFGTNDFIYFVGNDGDQDNLYRTDGTGATPTKIADDFYLSSNSVAEVDGAIYLSAGFYGVAGTQVYRITNATGTIEAVTDLVQTNGGAAPAGLSAIGSNVYFTANDGGYITGNGIYDRELWRYNAADGTTTKVTKDETLYPIETSAGVLSSYYFVAAPTKADSRWGSRRLYRTSPTTDQIEEVAGLPSYTDSNGETKQDVTLVFAGSKGLFYSARNSEGDNRDTDTYFVPTPYSYVDAATNNLIVTATDSNDAMTMTVDGDELVMNLNGVEERRDLSTFGDINVVLKNGDDKFTASDAVLHNMKISGDSGNDTIYGGGGNDNVLGGGGKNRLYGNKGDDRLRGSNGSDYLEGMDGNDRLYGWAGSDVLLGGNGVDYLYGDDTGGLQGNDQLNGGSGNDRLFGRGGNDTLVGGKQNDSIFGNDGDDLIQGGEGNDLLDAGAGADSLFGNAGDDTFNSAVDSALDLIDGGDDDDTLLGKDDDDDVALVEVVN